MANANRFHARSGILYVSPTNGAAAVHVSNISEFSMDSKSDRVEVTAMTDTTKTYVQGLPDSSGSFSGFRQSGAKQLLSAASDGMARNWYFYEDASTSSAYFFGTAFFDFSSTWSVSDAAKMSGTWAAATPTYTVGLT